MHMLHCALGRKRSEWSTRWNGDGWTTRTVRKHDANCDKQKRNGQSLNRATFHRRQNMLPVSTLNFVKERGSNGALRSQLKLTNPFAPILG